MSYVLKALVTRLAGRGMGQVAGLHGHGVLLEPNNDIVLLPITDAVLAQATSGDDTAILGFYDLTDGLASWAAALSRSAPIAYVDVEFFGGAGFQAAVGGSDAEIVLGPLFMQTHPGEAESRYHVPVEGEPMAVNAVLKWLGVEKGASERRVRGRRPWSIPAYRSVVAGGVTDGPWRLMACGSYIVRVLGSLQAARVLPPISGCL